MLKLPQNTFLIQKEIYLNRQAFLFGLTMNRLCEDWKIQMQPLVFTKGDLCLEVCTTSIIPEWDVPYVNFEALYFLIHTILCMFCGTSWLLQHSGFSCCTGKLPVCRALMLHKLPAKHIFISCPAEKLGGVKAEVYEVSQSEIGQKQKLRAVLELVNRILQPPRAWNQQKWSVDSEAHDFPVARKCLTSEWTVEKLLNPHHGITPLSQYIVIAGIHSKNMVAILHLLVALAHYFRAPIRLPENVVVSVVVVQVMVASGLNSLCA